MSTTTQSNRTLSISTTLGTDTLLLAGFEGTEALSQLFKFDLEMWSEDDSIDATDIVGKTVTLTMDTDQSDSRYFNGYVCQFSAGIRRDDLREYRAVVVPWLWFLTRSTNCQVFQSMTVPQIVEDVFSQFGFSDYTTSGITGSHPELDYVVQYNETAFNFVSRLLEREGIFYYFTHEDGKHTLALADSTSVFQDGDPSTIEYTYSSGARATVNRITDWRHHYEYRSGKWSSTDYNFVDNPPRSTTTPADNLLSDKDTVLTYDNISSYEKFEYPGLFQTTSDGSTYAQTRMEEDEVPSHVVIGSSQVHTLAPASKFTISGHDCDGEDGQTYVLKSVTHHARVGAPYRLDSGNGRAVDDYYNEFHCIPDGTTYRPPRETPRPRIYGSQTAVVDGPDGEEIWPDSYGRVKVQFHWDRVGVRDENTSCWIRCSQSMAGKNWGSMFIPRIGQEVVVAFLDGNPDRPLITGLVYNADQMPAYTLPDEKTKSYIKTNSSTGGDGYNEIRFEDLAGSEQIFVHAQRNMDQRVVNDMMEQVLNDRHLIVGGDDNSDGGNQYEKIYADKDLHVVGDQTEQIEGNFQLTIGMGDDSDGGSLDLLIGSDKTEQIEGNNDYQCAGNLQQSIEGDLSQSVSGDRSAKVTGNDSLEAEKNFQHKAGSNVSVDVGSSYYLSAGSDVVIEASSSLTLKVGSNYVVIDSSGVSVVGSMVNLNSGGSAGSTSIDSPTSPESPGDATQASPTDPTEADDSDTGSSSAP